MVPDHSNLPVPPEASASIRTWLCIAAIALAAGVVLAALISRDGRPANDRVYLTLGYWETARTDLERFSLYQRVLTNASDHNDLETFDLSAKEIAGFSPRALKRVHSLFQKSRPKDALRLQRLLPSLFQKES